MVVESSDGVECLIVWGLKIEETLGRLLVIVGLISEIICFTGTLICF